MADNITQEGIRALLSDALNSMLSLEILESTASTNDYVKQLSPKDNCMYRVIISDEQTSGKGRRGKVFYSPKGCGIYMSIKVTNHSSLTRPDQKLMAIAALAVCHAIEAKTYKQVRIKWPNDIYCSGEKVCGILCESQIEAHTGRAVANIAGIGINVYPSEELAQFNPSSGYLVEKEIMGLRNKIIASLITEFISLLKQGIDVIIEEYKQRSILIGHNILIEFDDSRTVKAYVQDINDNLQLVINYEDGKQEALDVANFSISF